MYQTLFAAALGFFTIPLVVLGIAAVGGIGTFLSDLGLPLAGYWSGFGLFVGLSILIGGGAGLWTTFLDRS